MGNLYEIPIHVERKQHVRHFFYLLLLIEMKTDSEWVLVSSAAGV